MASSSSAVRSSANAWPGERILFIAFFGFLVVVLNVIRDPTTFDKTLIPRLLALAAFLAVALPILPLLTKRNRLDPAVLRDPIVLWYAAYAAVTVASLAVAVNVTAGLTDVFKTLLALLVLALSSLLLPIVPHWQEWLMKLVLVATGVSAAVGWSVTIARHGVGFHSRALMEQVAGLMSSVNLYAHYLDMLLPVCLVAIVVLRGIWRWAAVIVLVAAGSMLALLQTRSAYLGLAAGLAFGLGAAVAFAGQLGISRRTRRAIIGSFLCGVAGVGTFIVAAPDDNQYARRIRSIVMEPTGAAARPREGGRLVIWGLTRRLIADHPLAGVGAGNFTIRLHEYLDADVDLSRLHTLNWTQPHNDPLWIWAEKGIFGLIAFAGIFVSAFLAGHAILRGGPAPPAAWLTVAILMSLVAYTVGSLFDFPLERVSHQVTLAVFLAALVVMRREAVLAARIGDVDVARAAVPWWILLPPAMVVIGLALAYSVAARRQEQAIVRAMLAADVGDWPAVVEHCRQAATPWRTLDPTSLPVAFRAGMAHLQLGDTRTARDCLEEARAANPNRMQILNNLGVLYVDAGEFDRAIECFSIVTDRYPNRVEGFLNLANCYIECGHPGDAVALLEQIPEALRTDAVRTSLSDARAQAAAGP